LFYLPDGIAPWPEPSVRWALDFALGFFGGPLDRRDEVIRQLDLAPLLDGRDRHVVERPRLLALAPQKS
jgi:hypothetical protein